MVKKYKKEQTGEQEQPVKDQGNEATADLQESEGRELKAKLTEKEKEATANYDKYLRAVAELDNYKKRAAKEKAEIIKYGQEDLIKDILPLVDSLDRALQHSETSTDIQAFKHGLKLIQDQLLCCLKKHGVEAIECTGKEFDPHFHEALMQVDSDRHEENKVITDLQRGYLLNGRLLRPSRVSVCKKTTKENNVAEQIADNGE